MEDLSTLIRYGAMPMHHVTCTAGRGQDKLSVVDARLRVYDVSNLRVADGSIMPTITTGNTHAPCVIIALSVSGNSHLRVSATATRHIRRESSMRHLTNLA